MKNFSKIVASVLLAGMTMLSACTSAEETQNSPSKNVGILYFAQPVEKVGEHLIQIGLKPQVYFDDLNSMVLALQAKKIDMIVEVPQPVAEYICNHSQNMKLAIAPQEKFKGNLLLRMGTMQENTKVYELLNSAIQELKENGKLEVLQKKYVDGYLQKGKEPKPVAMPKFDNAPVIKVAVTGDYPPIDLTAADGTPAGFNVAMLAEIAKLKKVNIIPVSMNSGARFISLNKGIVDALFFVYEGFFDDEKARAWYKEATIPSVIKTTDVYAQYPNRDVERK